MELRTKINIEPSPFKITFNDKVMFIGSCFASSIGSLMETGHLPVMINPAGAVYNPVSVCNTLDTITSGKRFSVDDLYFHNGTWLSFYHYTEFSADDPVKVVDKINNKSEEALSFLNDAGYLFITFGTARVYRLNNSGVIVSNCHRVPAEKFKSELLSVSDIVTVWTQQLDRLYSLFPKLKIIFTISPVRHWKDGAHGNQVSKSVLFLAVEELIKHNTAPLYFPAYELVMDDLRDYRFYSDDMLHPSASAINYIWDAFTSCYMENKTKDLWNELVKISKACQHRFNSDSLSNKTAFAKRMLEQIADAEKRNQGLDLTREKAHFQKLMDEGN